MEIHFKCAHSKDVAEEASSKLLDQTERKIQNLKKYLGKSDQETQVYVELGTLSGAHQNGDIWQVQINLDSRGKRFHAAAHGERLEATIDTAIHELDNSLRKAKQLHKSMLRKGGTVVKAMMRGFRTT